MTSPILKYLPQYTYADYCQWEGRWELIYGVPYAMAPAPSMYHQNINSAIIFQLRQALENCKFCQAFMPVDYKIGEEVVLQPDALVVCEPFQQGAFLTKTPEIVFEILSPSTRQKDLNLKYEIYERQGVKYYVIIDPVDKTATVYRLENEVYVAAMKTETDSFDFDINPCGFSIEFGKIW